MRTVIELPEEQLRQLADVCRREGLSRAEVIRRAVADYLDARHVRDGDDVFGLWRDRNLDGLQYERRSRREWPSRRAKSRTPGAYPKAEADPGCTE